MIDDFSDREPAEAPPAPPSPELVQAEGATSLVEYLRRRMEVIERELKLERERTRSAEDLLRTQDSARGEVDKQLKTLLDQLKQEKQEKETAELQSRSRGRIDALEQRLDEMHRTWAGLLSQAIDKREAREPDSDAAREELGALRKELESMKQAFSEVPAKIVPELAELKAQLPKTAASREEGDRHLGDSVRDLIARFAQTMTDRLGDMDRKLSLELEKHKERVDAVATERSLMQQAIEEQRHHVRQEYSKQQIQHQEQYSEHAGELAKSMARLGEAQENTGRDVGALKEAVEKLQQFLGRPEKAKDQLMRDLEQEKADLAKALRDRTEQLRAYSMERREVERSMGESLMEINRQLEAERAKHQAYESQIAELKAQIQGFNQDHEVGRRTAEAVEARFASLAAERDELARALKSESEKVQAHLASMQEAEKALEAREAERVKETAEERQRRQAVEQQAAELRAQIQTLTDHITKALRDKDRAESQAAGWVKERDELLSTLRKKDEMIAMLSATFQNMLKK
ncbi:MAG: hypothetical protein HY078_15625 [Elusimicrobia bacterium]|nr:hypothetical protein [Elusimicrobiota bacterium]